MRAQQTRKKGVWWVIGVLCILGWGRVVGAQGVSILEGVSPFEIRAELLRRNFNGDWILYPNWETNRVLIPLGIVPIPACLEGWVWGPMVSSLISTQWNGVTVLPVYVRMNDDTGAADFYRETGASLEHCVFSVGGQSVGYNPWWVAEVFQQDTTGWQREHMTQEDPRRAYLCSRREYVLWFVAASEAEGFRASLNVPPRRMPRRALAIDSATTNLHVDSFSVGKSNLVFTASWWPSDLPEGGAWICFVRPICCKRLGSRLHTSRLG